MKKLEITKVDNYEYYLKDKNNNEYNFNIEFQSIDIKPKIGDYIYISDELLDKNYIEYSKFYTFGPLNSKYGRKIIDENSPDVIKIETNNNSIYLKRLYG